MKVDDDAGVVATQEERVKLGGGRKNLTDREGLASVDQGQVDPAAVPQLEQKNAVTRVAEVHSGSILVAHPAVQSSIPSVPPKKSEEKLSMLLRLINDMGSVDSGWKMLIEPS